MGGCCSSSRKYQLRGTPIYYYCPPALEERESLTSDHGAFSMGLPIDVNLDTYRSPPTPIPFDVVLGSQKTVSVNVKEIDYKLEGDDTSPKKVEGGFRTFKNLDDSTIEEEDVCPTCFEEYDGENPRILTKCNHQFHLSCILEWMERSDTCPICNREMDFEA